MTFDRTGEGTAGAEESCRSVDRLEVLGAWAAHRLVQVLQPLCTGYPPNKRALMQLSESVHCHRSALARSAAPAGRLSALSFWSLQPETVLYLTDTECESFI
jgi:hypothetical protein